MAKAGAVASRRAVATYALRPQELLLRELFAQGQDFQPLPSQVWLHGDASCLYA